MAEARALRIGCVKYLNARPLISGWDRPVHLDHPAKLCQLLAEGSLDVALVSSFEYLRNPIYAIIDNISIASNGPVYSVVVAHGGELANLQTIELDPASETSVNLLRCIVAKKSLHVTLVAEGAEKSAVTASRGKLLIGDQAIRFRDEEPDCPVLDLGEEWQKQTSLPFVYALWLVRPEVRKAKEIADRLRALRDKNLAALDALILESGQFSAEFCRRYYRENLCFSFDEEQKKGLEKFNKQCQQHGLLPERAIEFRLV